MVTTRHSQPLIAALTVLLRPLSSAFFSGIGSLVMYAQPSRASGALRVASEEFVLPREKTDHLTVWSILTGLGRKAVRRVMTRLVMWAIRKQQTVVPRSESHHSMGTR